VSFMLGKHNFVRSAVLTAVATRGKRGHGLSRTKLLKRAG
jgi:hypothetical protein